MLELGQSVTGSDKAIQNYVKPFYLPVGNYLVTHHSQRSLTNSKLFRVSQGPVRWSRSNEDDAIKCLQDNQQAKRADYRKNFIAWKSLQDVDIQSFSVGCGDLVVQTSTTSVRKLTQVEIHHTTKVFKESKESIALCVIKITY